MKLFLAVVLSMTMLGCSSARLPYQPVDNSTGAPVSAIHQLTHDRLYVELATDGNRVESVDLILPDGSEVAPETLHHPGPPARATGGQLSVGIGTGVVNRNSGVGIGSGVDTSSTANYGHTDAIFPASKVGTGPWRARVTLMGFAPVEIELPALEAPSSPAQQ